MSYVDIEAANGRVISARLTNIILVDESQMQMGAATAGGTGFRIVIRGTNESFVINPDEYKRIRGLMQSAGDPEVIGVGHGTDEDSGLGRES